MQSLLDWLVKEGADHAVVLTIIGTIVTALGSLVALFLKEVLLTRSFESWKEKKSAYSIYRKYRDPMLLSAVELYQILDQITKLYPPEFLDSKHFSSEATSIQKNSPSDAYYLKYKLISTSYRFCAFLGWLELYREEITFLDSGKKHVNSAFDNALHNFRLALADGRIMNKAYWDTWRDSLIFREEQRAIGESMIVQKISSRSIMGYAEYTQQLADSKSIIHSWLPILKAFLTNPEKDKDFRKIRFQFMMLYLSNLIAVLDTKRLSPEMLKKAEEIKSDLQKAEDSNILQSGLIQKERWDS